MAGLIRRPWSSRRSNRNRSAAMANADMQAEANGDSPSDAIDTRMLGSILQRVRAQAAADPFSNPILLFALELTLRIDRGEIDLVELESLVQQLTAEAFSDRAARMANYLGENSIEANQRTITEMIEHKARAGSFEEFREAMSRSLFGVVFTAHPAFSMTLELA